LGAPSIQWGCVGPPEFIRRLEAAGLSVESTPGYYRVLREDKPLRKQNGMSFTLPFSPDTVRWRRAAIVELRTLGIDRQHEGRYAEAPQPFGHPASTAIRHQHVLPCQASNGLM
jgi:hypothetical protein